MQSAIPALPRQMARPAADTEFLDAVKAGFLYAAKKQQLRNRSQSSQGLHRWTIAPLSGAFWYQKSPGAGSMRRGFGHVRATPTVSAYERALIK
ncbi:hypothetical protein BQ8794_180153 [Mesorhizobium prunaredense]|uniref:Uncharacterized protein n=1 Tax=Mesorhizobium prunaredense TaxID=1631249 RepID=A0A1R3V4R0_9HYPH|nr:hypothetical protein BQ8794_180153 [Mesorhizobium prunaredense]